MKTVHRLMWAAAGVGLFSSALALGIGWLTMPLGQWQMVVTVPVTLALGFSARAAIAHILRGT